MMLFKVAQKLTNTLATFVRKFVAENFNNLSNLVALLPCQVGAMNKQDVCEIIDIGFPFRFVL